MKEKIVWITGASSGIGKNLALKFNEQNENIAVSARSKEKLIELKNNLNIENAACELSAFSISSSDEVQNFIASLSGKFDVDCLINNAGITAFKTVEDHTIDEVKNIIDINLIGSILAIKAVLPGMIKRKSGTIINIASVAAEKVFTHSSAYAASKAGLIAFTKSLREEVRQHNIRVINILPGATKTPIWPENAVEKFGDRMMDSADIADFVFDLYSKKSSIVTEEIVLRPMLGDL